MFFKYPKKQVDKNATKLNTDNNNRKKYKAKAIFNSSIYTKKKKIKFSTSAFLFDFIEKLSKERNTL